MSGSETSSGGQHAAGFVFEFLSLGGSETLAVAGSTADTPSVETRNVGKACARARSS